LDDDATLVILLQASVSTIERALALKRNGLVGWRMAQTKPGTLLRRQIPALVGSWRAEDVPGDLDIDLVSHSSEYATGTFLCTLSTVDLATGWTERIPLLGKGQTGVVAGLDRIRQQLPFRFRGLHPDTGSEFINVNPSSVPCPRHPGAEKYDTLDPKYPIKRLRPMRSAGG
jgi:hypothetical protein